MASHPLFSTPPFVLSAHRFVFRDPNGSDEEVGTGVTSLHSPSGILREIARLSVQSCSVEAALSPCIQQFRPGRNVVSRSSLTLQFTPWGLRRAGLGKLAARRGEGPRVASRFVLPSITQRASTLVPWDRGSPFGPPMRERAVFPLETRRCTPSV